MKTYGLIGYPLKHSFSKKYFLRKFRNEHIRAKYRNFEIERIEQFEKIIQRETKLSGLSVTSPYKEAVIPYLDELSREAKEMNAVNCIKINKIGSKPALKGYNTDIYGFENSLKPLLQQNHTAALILGTGGAARAAAFVCNKLKIKHHFVSRSEEKSALVYQQLDKNKISEYPIIINASPIGMHPAEHQKPDIPYSGITSAHILFDMIYNPSETLFLKEGKKAGAIVMNGYKMLCLQAEKAWTIFHSQN